MIPVLVLTHGDLAISILNAAQTIDPQLADRTEAMALPWDVDSDSASGSLKQRLRELDTGEGVLILTDMFGGTPSNLGITFLEDDKVEVITGVNLPMLVKLANLDSSHAGLLAIARQVLEHAREAIRVASDLMRPDAGS